MLQIEDVFRVDKVGAKPAAASPTSVLTLEEDPCDFMAEWPLEASFTLPGSKPVTSSLRDSPLSRSTLQGSLLRSSSSSDTAGLQQLQNVRPAAEEGHKISRSLVETLQKCLTSLPQSTRNCDSAGHSMSDPTGATTSSSRQSSSRLTSKRRRPRSSRRTPTTILETDARDFRDTVQKLTGVPSASPTPGAAPVRPRAQRAHPNSSSSSTSTPTSGSTFTQTDTLRSICRISPLAPLTVAPPRLPSALRPFLQHLQRSRTSEVSNATTAKQAQSCPAVIRACKREFDQTDGQSSPPSSSAWGSPESSMKRVRSAPTTSVPSSWWEQESSESRSHMDWPDAHPPFAMSNYSEFPSASASAFNIGCAMAKEEGLSGGGAVPSDLLFAPFDSADGHLAHEEREFNFSQIESWLSAESMRD